MNSMYSGLPPVDGKHMAPQPSAAGDRQAITPDSAKAKPEQGTQKRAKRNRYIPIAWYVLPILRDFLNDAVLTKGLLQ